MQIGGRPRIQAREEARIAEKGVWFTGGFCTGLRGEEVVRIELAGTANSIEKWMQRGEKDPYFMFVVSVRSKGNVFGAVCWRHAGNSPPTKEMDSAVSCLDEGGWSKDRKAAAA
jgi:hypothetical protein